MSGGNDWFEPTKRQWAGFWSMIVQQTQNAFNDKMAQFILVPLGGAVGFSVESVAGLMISLPFVLFAPLAGWLSDRCSKRTVIFLSAVLQLLVLVWICGAVMMKNLPLALCGFFGLAVQSAFFSPAKMGINKELVGSGKLGFATAIQQMTAMLAMLAGQIVAGKVFDDRLHAFRGSGDAAWQAALGPLLVLTVLAAPALLMAWVIPPVPAQGGGAFSVRVAFSHFGGLRLLWSDKPLRWASFGVAFFWGFAAYLNLWSVKLAKVMSHGGEGFGSLSSLFMASASLGMAAGFGFASWLLRRSVNLGWVPLAGLLMAGLSIALALVPVAPQESFLRFVSANPAEWFRAAAAAPSCAVFLLVLGLLAFVSAIFLAPLNAWVQDRYPADKRGELQAAVNLQDCFAGITAVLVITGLELGASALGMDALTALRPHMLLVGALCLIASVMIIRLLPAEFIRLLASTVVRVFYHLRVVHADRIPAKGGVMILPNHVTFADAFYIATACRRPVRFVMDEVFAAKRAIRVFTSIFDTVTIRRDQPLEAIRTVIQALRDGDLICLFPEGQLTRTGGICALQRGFGLIARKAGHPLVPMWCDGLWGSVFSFERGRFFRKWPRKEVRKIVCAFGEPLDPREADVERVMAGMLRASADAVGRRFAGSRWSRRLPRDRAEVFRPLEGEDRRRAWINGHQIGSINAIPWHSDLHVLRGDQLLDQLPSLFGAFCGMFRVTVREHDAFDGGCPGVWIGGDTLRQAIQTTRITAEIVFHDFGSRAVLEPIERAGLCHCPALAIDGRVVAMSMPHPPPSKDNFEPQHGHKPHSWGKLLPGWFVTSGPDGEKTLHGPAAKGGLALPPGCGLDAEVFLMADARDGREKSR
jgi:acyl-[acyl-carrier-protein]-phospholipid O-acyltransferase / long-chain-fatty-acid--[acyl-carrier-protein] ligase